jgi:hypothetical protein
VAAGIVDDESMKTPNGCRKTAMVRTTIAIVSLFGFLFSGLMFMYGSLSALARPPHPASASTLMLIGLLSVFTTVQLIRRKKWAWWGAMFWTSLIFLFAMFCVWSAFYSTDAYARSEASFGFGIGVILMIPAIITAILLNIPQVRFMFLGRSPLTQ